MEMLVLNQDVANLENRLLTRTGAERLISMVELAWHLRQRDSHRARLLLEQAQANLAETGLTGWSAAQRQQLQSRHDLTQAELAWLHSDLKLAKKWAMQGLSLAQANQDSDAMLDAWYILGSIATDAGGQADVDQSWGAAQAFCADPATSSFDPLRLALVQWAQAAWNLLGNRQNRMPDWEARVSQALASPVLAAAAWDYRSMIASIEHDYGASITHSIEAWKAALASGQIRRAISNATNVGDDFANLNDHQSALEWMQRGLTMARECGWPVSVGLGLAQTANILRGLQRHDEAVQLLQEALQVMAALPKSRNYAVTLLYMGELALERNEYQEVLDIGLRLEQHGQHLGQADFYFHAFSLQMQALMHLGRARDALQVAFTALGIAQKQQETLSQIVALRNLAELYRQFRDLHFSTSDDANPDPVIHYLSQAYQVARTISGYTIPADLLDALAQAWATRGDTRQAFTFARLANQSRESAYRLDANNRSLAMQVRHQTERARSDSEYHRELAQAEAKRAQVLQQTSATLAHLGAVGQEITAQLDIETVFLTLYRHVNNLLDACGFSIYLTRSDGLHLYRAFGLENGKPLPQSLIAINDPNKYSALCAREQREILLDASELAPGWIPGTLQNHSALFAPLALREKVLGVMAIQSRKPQAYDERACLIFRSLCAYGAIALDNASAYQRLQDAQSKLVVKEKLAALGALVAGVAHELNTPLGNSLMMASALEEKTRQFERQVKTQRLRLEGLKNFLLDTREAAVLIMRGLSNATELVNSFKQVAVDRTSAQRRIFDLHQTCHEIIATMMSQVRHAGYGLELDMPKGIQMHSYPGPLGQVIANFINNALLHAFDGCATGCMNLSASLVQPGRVQIVFEDDGVGIPEAHISHIFDPFFTTKMGQGGSGLGLSISYNIITSILSGKITVQSWPRVGTRFVLDLPLEVADEHEPGEH